MIHSFLLVGQSNMAGRGFLNEVAPIRDTNIKMLRNGRWTTMSEPLNFDRPFAGIGPGASFAAAWRTAHPDEVIGLIPCADGGSAIDEWYPGDALFDHAVLQAKLAQRTSKIEGILWHQGENDCEEDLIPGYEGKLEYVMNALREQLGLEDVPLLVGGLGEYLPTCKIRDYYANAPLITKQIMHYAETHENCYFVTAKGLTPNPDLLHFSSKSQRIFGYRYFTAYHTLSSVFEPLADEENDSICGTDFQELSVDEKLAILKRDFEAGKMIRQEYNFRVNMLIKEM